MKPIIGIITRPDHLESGNKVDVVYSHIRIALTKQGAIPLPILPPTDIVYDGKTKTGKASYDVTPLLDLCDGFIFQGGDQFYDYDLDIVDYAYKKNKPTLGICLGMQLLSFYKNGTLGYLKEKTESHYNKKQYAHTIFIKQNSKLASILNCTQCEVNSRHREQVLKTDLEVVATSKEGIIEAVEDPQKKFFLGVQWHPEDMIAYDKVMNALFQSFISECKE